MFWSRDELKLLKSKIWNGHLSSLRDLLLWHIWNGPTCLVQSRSLRHSESAFSLTECLWDYMVQLSSEDGIPEAELQWETTYSGTCFCTIPSAVSKCKPYKAQVCSFSASNTYPKSLQCCEQKQSHWSKQDEVLDVWRLLCEVKERLLSAHSQSTIFWCTFSKTQGESLELWIP